MGTALFTIGIIMLGVTLIIAIIIMGIYVMESDSKIYKMIFWGVIIGISIAFIVAGLNLGVDIQI